MARTVADTALLLSVLSSGSDLAPLGFPTPFEQSVPALEAPLRIGWSRTLGGLDIQPAVTDVLDSVALPALRELGHMVADIEPQLSEADHVFRVLRGIAYARNFAEDVAKYRDQLGAELIANTEAGEAFTLTDYLEAREQRTQIYGRMANLFTDIDVLAAPVTAVLPFPAGERWPREINGVAQPDYLEWMRASWRISVTGFTAISVPGGFSADGLPVGLQLIAPPRHEARLLALAAQFERIRPFWRETPLILSTTPTPSTITTETEVNR